MYNTTKLYLAAFTLQEKVDGFHISEFCWKLLVHTTKAQNPNKKKHLWNFFFAV